NGVGASVWKLQANQRINQTWCAVRCKSAGINS
ncbi:hypothetical protein, partial [Escherichia coli]